ncbi:diguanylate cyclase [Halopseudomonas nanhaiensis]|uniref:GGDEF domain-containing protein n=1 Tax=Halopseudomonas nanhaiensis TaxID=2830842 RepID=UPI001CBEED51|nr:GGDEF domain-containing protein [Halopseudomonas nanhaiensis]UAW98474.1 diguanylate cyclase [Halopseudomonas nanhaiensis]
MSDPRNNVVQSGQEAMDQLADHEELLKRSLVRISIAADGLDPLLDRRLRELRGSLRADAPTHLLADLMPELEHAVLKADAERQERLSQIARHLQTLAQNLQRRHPAGSAAQALRQLQKQLDAPIEYANQIPALLEELALVQQLVLEVPSGAENRGLLARLFKRSDVQSLSSTAVPEQTPDAEPDAAATSLPAGRPVGGEEQQYSQVAGHIETILINLLAELQVLDDEKNRCERLREQVSQGLNWYELAAVLDELTLLVLNAQQKRQQDFERYLQQLNRRLAQFQGNLEAAHDVCLGSFESGKELEVAIRSQVAELHGDVRQATDLEALKATVESKLDALLLDVDRARSSREHQEEETSSRLRSMIERIQVMEVEAQTFRKHLDEQRQRAMLDNLTGLANRAGLQKRMEEEFDRWHRYGGELLLAVLDVDHFKTINDRFGHLAGDKVLRLIAHQLSARLRKTDFIGRFGGEEFVLLMPGTTVEQGALVLDELRSGIEQCPFHFKAERVTITISLGFTQFNAGDSLDKVFDRADQAMYQAKKAGRNRIVKAV